ncbi:lysozyme [Pseudomonas chlororaphis]|uniref:Lysozyme n=1 Tax=Pseudomonas chlororaphis TaxID=587753 RepID=A0AAX3FQH6_9PSED|nr:lysozyme [Pseudomonas chlororaphis]AZC38236.1 Phage lysin, 1,4-beta-N-acetylmuramidase or lysozyme [Pseudomonas chlororaphis subsp. piscium]AZC44785.1 Phage lysin, 1,4-beta-N-acetylmuramidase or lysozyme [Pseudomonas chlororaphis subsp. piscium]WDG70390.1 lysozyme [Pseudomonas chlororaphis]WDH31823.1 lysozyme [Pseudomonas chlororaphis]WDH68916.1 lysozyme [Pseudomonas chlororaphis]
MTYTLSKRGLSAIKSSEGCKLNAYQDGAGIWTIGYGTTGKVNGQSVSRGMAIDKEYAERLLKNALLTFEKDVNRLVKFIGLTQNQYDALVSLIYNIGTSNFSQSTLLRELNKGNVMQAAEQFLVWCKLTDAKTRQKVTSAGLLNRRRLERELFLL